MNLLRFLLLCVVMPVCAASDPVPDDFAAGALLNTRGDAAIYRLSLPPAAYLGLTRDDLGDLRVFNAAGEAVPHALRRPTIEEGGDSPLLPLPVYPFERLGEGGRERVSLRLYADDRSAVVDLNSGANQPYAARIVSYLIDLSGLQEPPGALTVDWTGTDVVHLSVDASDDLSLWRSLNREVTLVRLDYGGHRLERSEIPLSVHGARYLRLAVIKDAAVFSIQSVEARFRRPQVIPYRDSIRLQGIPAGDESNAWLFDTGGRMPVDRIELELSQRNSLVSAEISSASDGKAPWRIRGARTFYRLEVDGVELAERAIDLSAVSDRFWRLELTSDPAGMGKDAPWLIFSWMPHDLYFLARGAGPFLLAYGDADSKSSEAPVDPLLRRLSTVKPGGFIGDAEVAKTVSLGGDARLKLPGAPFPWRTWLLWAVLVLGVVILGWMAWRLSRQIGGR